MSQPIYAFSTTRATEAWYRLSKEEQDSLSAKVVGSRETASTKNIILCASRWASEWDLWSVDRFPSIETLQENIALDRELGWFRYVRSGPMIMGTKHEIELSGGESSQPESGETVSPIYTFSAGRMTEAWYRLSEAERQSLMAKVTANREKAGTKNIIFCNSRWCSEWGGWAVDEFASIEALQKNIALDREIGWFRYVRSGPMIMGTKYGLDLP